MVKSGNLYVGGNNTGCNNTDEISTSCEGQKDDDNDGVINALDICLNTPLGETVDINGCSERQKEDDDDDGIMNGIDICSNTTSGETVDGNGCSESQKDDDGDLVMNNVDNCLDTPIGETVDSNGCSESQKDDDGDLVMNNVDTCPDTPTGETVDSNGCSGSQLDDDGDGVMNDIDTCPDTPAGEIVDSNGCSDSQLDDDGDNVMNNVDQCPDTPTNVNVDAYGCPVFTLPTNNFAIEVLSETCPDKNNGQIYITATETYSYVATINGNSHNFSNNSLTVSNMQPGTYEICIMVSGETFEQCFNVTIKEGTTVSGKASVSSKKASINIERGTAPYNVFINGQELFKTNDLSFELDVKHGDLVQVKTAIDCEGVFSKTIDLFETLTVYPNPTDGIFEIALPLSLKDVKIELFTTNSQLISSKQYVVVNGKVKLNIENMPAAMYFLKVHLENPVSVKIIKK